MHCPKREVEFAGPHSGYTPPVSAEIVHIEPRFCGPPECGNGGYVIVHTGDDTGIVVSPPG